jgi:hypothetical protein
VPLELEAWVADEPKRKRKRPARRKRFGTPVKAHSNLKSISAAQKRSHQERRKLARDGDDGVDERLPIIENITKSERAFDNALRQIRRQEDLNDFE